MSRESRGAVIGTRAATLATGLAMLALIAGGCTVNVQVDPGSGIGTGGATDDAVDELLDAVLEGSEGSGSIDETVDDILRATLQSDPDGSGTGNASRAAAADSATDSRDRSSPIVEVVPPAKPGAAETTSEPAVLAEPPTIATESAPAISPPPTPPETEPADFDPDIATVRESLPGEPYEYGPDEGMSLAVVGVDFDDVLNVRDVPFGEIIATLGLANPIAFVLEVRAMPSGEPIDWFDSWSEAIVATGRTRKLPTTVWHEVQVAGVTGWASGAYLAPIGLTDDITAHLIDRLGERPEAATLIDLARIVGEAFASSEPPSRVVVTVGPIIFEALGEVTVDVLNLGDDSLLGYRLHVFATPAAEDWMSEDPGPFTLRTVERTILCHSHRGVTAGGLCI